MKKMKKIVVEIEVDALGLEERRFVEEALGIAKDVYNASTTLFECGVPVMPVRAHVDAYGLKMAITMVEKT